MKKFNLEEAKAHKRVCTIDGTDVSIIEIDMFNLRTISVHISGTPEKMIFYYHLDGTLKCNKEHSDLYKDYDLMMKD